MQTIISRGEVFAKYTLRRSLRQGGLGSIVLRCFENKMLGNATLLLKIFFGNQVKRVKLTVESFL